jgi:4-hydroxybenzoyl-CoA thioesterase
MQAILDGANEKHGIFLKQRVFFGDCDPIGIVFYPNIFSWFDRAFHMLLDPLGIGLMDAKAQFHRPLRSGDEIQISLQVLEWGSKSVTLAYEVKKEDLLCVNGVEVRGLFRQTGQGMIAGDIAPLKEALSL